MPTETLDMRYTIIPKSDQLNADDLLTGPITIKITGVTVRGGQEQPVAISYEGDNGKPYKACKSMCRVMVSAWGADSSKYVGRSLTLFCDPKVKWGGMEVGGIRISHMSDIDSALTMALTVTRANKKPFTVKPLKATAPAGHSPVSPSQEVPAAVAPNAAAQEPSGKSPGPAGNVGHMQNSPRGEPVRDVPASAAPDTARDRLAAAGSMGALAKAWADIGQEARSRLAAFKDECKDRILQADKEVTT